MRNLIGIEAELSNLSAGGGVVSRADGILEQELGKPTRGVALDVRRGCSRRTPASALSGFWRLERSHLSSVIASPSACAKSIVRPRTCSASRRMKVKRYAPAQDECSGPPVRCDLLLHFEGDVRVHGAFTARGVLKRHARTASRAAPSKPEAGLRIRYPCGSARAVISISSSTMPSPVAVGGYAGMTRESG